MTRPGQAGVDPHADDLEEEQGAQEDQQVPPAPEDHGQRHHRQPDHGDPPAAAGRLDPPGEIGQPGRPHLREQAQAPGVGPVSEPEPRGVRRDQEGAGHDHDRQHQPGRGADRERMRQGRRRAGGAPPAGRSMRRDAAGRGARRNGVLGVLAHRARPPGAVTPRAAGSSHHACAGPLRLGVCASCLHARSPLPPRTSLCGAAELVDLSGVAADVEMIGAVRAALRGAAQPELARPMQAYMKSATPFLGVRVPMMRTLTRAEAKLRPFTSSADLIDTVLRLWREAGYREERYAAIALLDTPAARRLRDPAVLPTLRELIVTGAWWDYVDELAHRVGDLLLSWPAEVRPALLTWTRSDDRWLRRAAIICQLGTRDRADVELLTTAIESAISDSDFFLRKAIGWALRDYARTDPAWVRSFAETHELSPLSRREALKHLS